ncbi:MAG: gliding motility-associated C-terminal domain-containing protein [Chitinophagales bacterium]|nr:gliding motility-associated C-terminal domain-containing protein [Chitinophagales bacterium]
MTRVVTFLILLTVLPSFSLQAQPTCEGNLGPNILANGDFGIGSTSFLTNNPFYSTDLDFIADWPTVPNSYAVTSSTEGSDISLCWINTSDNSGATNAYMLVANVGEGEQNIFNSTLEVCDGIDYLLSFDVINLSDCPENANPVLSILIDGAESYNTGILPQDGNWHTHEQLISIPAGTDFIQLSFQSLSAGSLALDNIALRHCSPEVVLPNITTACPNNAAVITPMMIGDMYPNPHYQWQQSFDGGNSWTDITSENAPTLTITQTTPGIFYRVQIANGPINFLNESCRATSNSTSILIAEPIEIFLTPLLCEGEVFEYNGHLLTEPGNYELPIPGESGCDSLIHIQLFNYPAYEHLYNLNLCEGDLYQGEAIHEDTIIVQHYSTINGCDSTIITEIEVANSDALSINGEEILCNGATTILDAPPTYVTYLWNTGNSSHEIEVQSGGHYSLTVTNSAGCELTAEFEVAESTPGFLAMVENTSCPDATDGQISASPTFGGSPPYLFNLNDQAWQLDANFLNLSAGIYNIGIQDAWGCEHYEDLEILAEELPSLDISGIPTTAVDIGDTIHLGISTPLPGYQFSWQGDGLISCDTCNVIAWQPFYNGILSLSANAPNSCNQQVEITLDLRDRYRIYIPTAFSPNGDGNNDTFYPQMGSNATQVVHLNIYDRWGGHVFSSSQSNTSDTSSAWDGSRQGQELDTGTYLYETEIEFKDGNIRRFAGVVNLLR